jgi:glutaredoxin
MSKFLTLIFLSITLVLTSSNKADIMIITRARCYFSNQMRNFLNDHNVHFEELINITEEGKAMIEEKKVKGHTYPIVFLKGKLIGGWTEASTDPELLKYIEKLNEKKSKENTSNHSTDHSTDRSTEDSVDSNSKNSVSINAKAKIYNGIDKKDLKDLTKEELKISDINEKLKKNEIVNSKNKDHEQEIIHKLPLN